MNYEMTTAIYELMNTIKADYYRYTSRNGRQALSEVNKQMIDEFNASLSYQEGRKYIKVLTGGAVWGFIVKGDDKKFQVGDILKPAGWATPTRNAARGNIFGDYTIRWTGPEYLR